MLTGLLSEVVHFLQHIRDQLTEDKNSEKWNRSMLVKMLIDEHRHNEHQPPKGLVRLDCPLCQLRKES